MAKIILFLFQRSVKKPLTLAVLSILSMYNNLSGLTGFGHNHLKRFLQVLQFTLTGVNISFRKAARRWTLSSSLPYTYMYVSAILGTSTNYIILLPFLFDICYVEIGNFVYESVSSMPLVNIGFFLSIYIILTFYVLLVVLFCF